MKKMKYYQRVAMLVVCICMLTGCSRKEEILFAEMETDTDIDMQAADYGSEASAIQTEAEAECEQWLLIHICGAVNYPGVYEFPEDARIYQAVEMAGGFTAEADTEYLNMAEPLTDGMKIYIPTLEETMEMKAEQESLENADEKVNLNAAGLSELCTLPGIGEAKAKSIIAYREQIGKFDSIEQIMDVEGIKEGLFYKIKDSIKVS